jgi:hypothetical protein
VADLPGRPVAPGVSPPQTARVGNLVAIVAIVALAATGLAAVGAVLPAGSVVQYVALGVAALPGLPAYLAFPVWEILAGGPGGARRARGRPPVSRAHRATTTLGAVPR